MGIHTVRFFADEKNAAEHHAKCSEEKKKYMRLLSPYFTGFSMEYLNSFASSKGLKKLYDYASNQPKCGKIKIHSDDRFAGDITLETRHTFVNMNIGNEYDN